MFRKFCVAACLFLSLCIPANTEAAWDGYYFSRKQYEKTTVQINVVTYKSEEELRKVLKNPTGIETKNVIAYSVLKPPFDTCTIHMVDPAVSYHPEYIGHEFLHCVYGQWHRNNNINE